MKCKAESDLLRFSAGYYVGKIQLFLKKYDTQEIYLKQKRGTRQGDYSLMVKRDYFIPDITFLIG